MRSLVLLLLAAACTKPAAPDAGTVHERGTDLRSAINTLFPEYRGAQLTAGRAAVVRTLAPAGQADLARALELARQNGFSPDDAGTALWRAPFAFEARLAGGAVELEVRLALNPDEMARVLSAPQGMTSEALAHWLPKLQAPKVAERFELELVWQATTVSRADFLVWQLVDGALSSGWTVDAFPPGWQRRGPDGGGPGGVPEEFTLIIRQPAQGQNVTVERKGTRARLQYELATFERR